MKRFRASSGLAMLLAFAGGFAVPSLAQEGAGLRGGIGQGDQPVSYSPQGGQNRSEVALEAPLPQARRLAPTEAQSPARAPETTGSINDTYAPAGIRAGSFELFPSLELRGGFQEVSRTRTGFGSVTGRLDARGGLGLVEVDFSGLVEAERTRESSGIGDVAADANLRLASEINQHLILRGGLIYQHIPENGFQFDTQGSLVSLPDETVYGVNVEVELRGNRAALTPRLGYERHHFSRADIARDLDYNLYETGLRASYEFSPMLLVYADASRATARFDRGVGNDGEVRGSVTDTGLLGAVYSPGDWLQADVAIGLENARFRDGSRLSGARAQAGINWQATALTGLSLSASHGIAADVATSGGVRETSVSLGVLHRFRPHLELDASTTYRLRRQQSGLVTARLDARAQLAYAMRRGVFLTAGGGVGREVQGGSDRRLDWQVYTGLRVAR